MQLLLVRSLWAAPAVGLTSGTLKHTRAPSHAQRALSAACNTDHALCRVQRLCGAGFTCSPQSCKVVHEGSSSSSTCNIPHCIIKAIQTTRGVFGNACLPQGSARLDALVSLSWPRVRVCVNVAASISLFNRASCIGFRPSGANNQYVISRTDSSHTDPFLPLLHQQTAMRLLHVNSLHHFLQIFL